MDVAIVVVIALAAAAFVAAPLRRGVPVTGGDARLEDLYARKRSALEALIDIESEHAVGKLSDADYEGSKATHESEALAILDEIDAYGDTSSRDELEGEIQAVRARLERGTCPRCGAARPPGSRCRRCGA
jgi:tRNA(Ile2) C34 agmatinyltransferase TiaS